MSAQESTIRHLVVIVAAAVAVVFCRCLLPSLCAVPGRQPLCREPPTLLEPSSLLCRLTSLPGLERRPTRSAACFFSSPLRREADGRLLCRPARATAARVRKGQRPRALQKQQHKQNQHCKSSSRRAYTARSQSHSSIASSTRSLVQ